MRSNSFMKMPEFLVFAKLIVTGFFVAEVFRIAFYLGANFEPILWDLSFNVKIGLIVFGILVCMTYAIERGGYGTTLKVARSFRLDLLISFAIGFWVNDLISPWLSKFHTAFKNADPNWAPAIFIMLFAMLLSPLVQKYRLTFKNYRLRLKGTTPQMYFIADKEIGDEKEDLFASKAQAKSFAETILASGVHTGLVFGVDGPWGVGKTSFINLAQDYWEKEEVIVCRFEPLRYASEPDLTDRLIRDLSDAIQKQVFAPEFRPTASRYARLIKGKADISFLGFKLSLEPSQETIDELLDDIDDSLKRIGRRVIIVIDDLDRLDLKTAINVLFATRRTFKLSQATYILCYDTEILTGKEEGFRVREFLEKFVTIKLSLFVDSSSISRFLRMDWDHPENQLGSIPSDTMIKLGSVLNELADILDGELAANYLPLVGDLRKVKRFVNAMLLMQIEKSDLGRTDFNKRDLINLMLLHLNYPGLFRRIYGEETEGRSGTFSVRREFGTNEYSNSEEFSELLDSQQGAARFLLNQLFDVETLNLGDLSINDEAFMASRACFNHQYVRNLEKYLKLLVRFVTPEPQDTFILYKNAVERVRNGATVHSILTSPDFYLKEKGEHPHDQFWSLLVNSSHDFSNAVVEEAINKLVDYLPRYSLIGDDYRGLRQSSIYSLLRLLDRAGWDRVKNRQLPNKNKNVIEIAWRIFGEHSYESKGLLQRLSSEDRGVLGWNDLMIFRLSCSADRQGQLYNLYSALVLHQDENAATAGNVSNLALNGMRKLSQEVFAQFKQTYIDLGRNFFSEVNDAEDEKFLGDASFQLEDNHELGGISIVDRISSARSIVKSFVIYQLSNKLPPNGSGVGCGYYDEFGAGDNGRIAVLMNEYIFDFCFNPAIKEDNVFLFLDYCLSNLSNPFFSGNNDEERYFASKAELSGGFDVKKMEHYWSQHQELIRHLAQLHKDRYVYTSNYRASYRDDLPGVFKALDELAEDLKETGGIKE